MIEKDQIFPYDTTPVFKVLNTGNGQIRDIYQYDQNIFDYNGFDMWGEKFSIVLRDDALHKESLFCLDISTGENREIYKTDSDVLDITLTEQSMWGDRIVWSSNFNNGKDKIFYYDLMTENVYDTGIYGRRATIYNDTLVYENEGRTYYTNIPEPATAGLMGLGLAGLLASSRKRKSA